jgi:tetratricopeptide (TPR) repeat protein
MEEGRVQQAIDRFEYALQFEGSPIMIHAQLGVAAVRQGRLEDGIASLERAAFSWDPSTPATGSWAAIWSELSTAYLRAERLESALAACETARFLKLQIPLYVESLLGIARKCRWHAALDLERDIYVRVLHQLSAWDRFEEWENRLVRQTARSAASLHTHEGTSIDTALRFYRKPLGNSTRMMELFVPVFREEMDRIR